MQTAHQYTEKSNEAAHQQDSCAIKTAIVSVGTAEQHNAR
jgi:hypothetical protein